MTKSESRNMQTFPRQIPPSPLSIHQVNYTYTFPVVILFHLHPLCHLFHNPPPLLRRTNSSRSKRSEASAYICTDMFLYVAIDKGTILIIIVNGGYCLNVSAGPPPPCILNVTLHGINTSDASFEKADSSSSLENNPSLNIFIRSGCLLFFYGFRDHI